MSIHYYFRTFVYFIAYHLISDKIFLKIKYRLKLGRYPNLDQPVLFTEKLQWTKLNERRPLRTICADKIKAKEYVQQQLGSDYIIPIIFETENVLDLTKDNLPDYPIIIKTNHDSGSSMVFKDKDEFDEEEVQRKFSKRMGSNFYYAHREWEYKNIKPKIFIEKLIKDKSENLLLNDYKIHCFNGEPKYIQTIFDRYEGVKENWFDANWNAQEMWYFSKERKEIAKPDSLAEMLRVAKKLSEGFKYVRVDLYDVDGKVIFGEFTFHPYGGFMQWNPSSWDEKLGNLIQIKVKAQVVTEAG